MNLRVYKQKRTFKTTKEPKPKVKATTIRGKPKFCVQKHAASHLHYDFRLEYKGVLLSWAVPKGPSLDPSQKRLAVQVEDHPYDYRTFEGTIPKGNYGAGTVMLWDEGVYTFKDAENKKEIEKAMKEGLEKGILEIELFGTKLHGKFILTRLKKEEEKPQWLFFKKNDSYADPETDITELDRSVKTNRTMDEIGNVKKK